MATVLLTTQSGGTVREFEVSDAARRRLETDADQARRALKLPNRRNGESSDSRRTKA